MVTDGYLEDGYFGYSSIVSPITSSLANSSLKDLDPALYYAIDYFTNIIKKHAGSRWDAESALVRTDLVGKIVNQTLPYDPLPFPQQNQFRFPLLAVYRTEEDYEWKVISKDHITCVFDVLYILPPLEVEAAERLYPFLSFIGKALLERTKQGFDTNINSGEQYWHESGIEEIGFIGSTYGKAPVVLNSNIQFPLISMQLKVVERLTPQLQNYQSFAGSDMNIEVANIAPTLDLVDIEINI